MKKGGTGLPPRIVIYGRPAVGKTSVAAYAPNPVFLMSPGETGLHTLIDSGQLPGDIPNLEVPDWQSYIGLIEDLTDKDHQRKALVVDVVNGMEKLANVFTCQRDYAGDMGEKGFMSYQSGYRAVAMGAWKESLVALDKLRNAKKMMVILLAHTGSAKVPNPMGLDYQKWAPAFDGRWAWEATYAWADIVLFADFDIAVIKEKDEAKAKGRGGDRRVFRTNWEPGYDAKNRHGFPDEIEMGNSGKEAWNNLAAAIDGKANGTTNG
jgi:hypothetical protein